METLEISKFNLVLACIKNIENLDGNDPNQLPDFIEQIENILPTISEFDSANSNVLFGYIKNKCIGKIREAIHRHPNVTSWPILKEILITNFGEKDNSNDLMDSLKTCRMQGTIENYYYKINKLANRIHNRNLTHNDNTYSTEEINRIALKTFRENLPEPTRTMIFSRNPSTIEGAFKIVLEARHQNYTQFGPATQYNLNTNVKVNFSNDLKNNPYNPRNYYNNKQTYNNNNNNNYHRNNNSFRPYNSNNFENFQNSPQQNQQFFHNPINPNPQFRNTFRGSSNQTRRSNYSQSTNRNQQQYDACTNCNLQRQPIPSNFHNGESQKVEPMEIGNSSVKFSDFRRTQLPYIVIKNPIKKLKFIIDTGAEFSLINPNICHPRWKTEINIVAKALGTETLIKKLCRFPIFSEFKLTDYFCEFLECKFNDKFDGIIGNNILRDLNSVIDLPNRQFITKNAVITIFNSKEEEMYNEISYKENFIEMFNYEIGKHNITTLIKTDHLQIYEKEKLLKIAFKYKNVFYNKDEDLTFTNEIKHRILTKHDMPIYSRLYRYPEVHKEEVDLQIENMLKQGIIRHSHSPYNSPIWVVPKKLDASKEQKWRIVIDYRKLNDVTVEDRYPIPNIDDIFDKLGKCQYFTTLDLAKGFHQVEMHPEDIPKTAFSTATGHYEFLRMPFGLRNAPATFQRLINNVLKEYIGSICLVYLDDVLIFSTSIEEHLEAIEKVLKRLNEANLKVQIDKCTFLAKETKFLGHVINPDGIKPNPEKVKAIDEIALPKTQKEIKSFLGITGYYRRFIKDYSRIAHHLIKYLKQGAKVNTNDKDFQKAFKKLKILIKNDPILVHPDFSKTFTLVTDASNFALGAALMQGNKVISFASRTLNGHERNYSTIEKKLLAIVWATKYFRPYLFGRRFTIKTDHRPLVWLNNIKEPNAKLQRWKIRLNEFDFDIIYIKGKENVIADGLSRLNYKKSDDEVAINLHELFDEDVNTVHSAESDDTDFIKITERPVNIFRHQIIMDSSNFNSCKTKIIFKNKIRHILKVADKKYILEFMKEKLPAKGLVVVYCPNIDLFREFQSNYTEYFAKNKYLKVMRSPIFIEDIIDREKLLQLIETTHLKNNHRGILEVFEEIKRDYFYPKLQKEIQKYINNCGICKLAKFDRSPVKYKLNVTPTPKHHNDIVHIDIWYPQRGAMYLTSIDKLTKYATAQYLEDRTWVSILTALKQRIQYLGKPKQIVFDSELDTAAIREFLKDQEINLHTTTTYLKTGNADVERLHGTLNEHVRLFNADPSNTDELQDKVFKAIVSYNNSIHSTTKHRPIDLINNLISQENLSKFSESLHEQKSKRINTINTKTNRVDESNFVNDAVKNNRVSKSKPKYKKISNYRKEGNYILSNDNKFKKIYKSQIKRKNNFDTL